MERNGKVELNPVVGQLAYHFGQAHGAQGYAFGRHSQTLGRGNAVDGLDRVFVVHERLSHAHKHNIGEGATKLGPSLLVDGPDLIINLVGLEVAHAFEAGCCAECTAHGAAHLA